MAEQVVAVLHQTRPTASPDAHAGGSPDGGCAQQSLVSGLTFISIYQTQDLPSALVSLFMNGLLAQLCDANNWGIAFVRPDANFSC